MKICNSCGAALEDRAQFCTSCGAALAGNVSTTSADTPAGRVSDVMRHTEIFASDTTVDSTASADTASADTVHDVENTPRREVPTEPTAVSREAAAQFANTPAPARRRVKKQPSGIAVKLLCIFLSFVFCVVLCATSLLGVVKWSLDSEVLEDAVSSVSLDELEDFTVSNDGEDVPIAEFILDFCDDSVKEKYDLDEDKVMQVLKDTRANEFIGEIVGDYSAYILEGEELRELNGERVTKWIRKNESKIEDIIEYEFKESDYRELEEQIDDSKVVRMLSKGSLESESGIDVVRADSTMLLAVYIAMCVLCAAIAALIMIVNRRRLRALFTYVTASIAVVGAFFLVVLGGAYITAGIFLPSFTVSLLGVITSGVLLRGVIMLMLGIGASVIHKLIFDSRHKA